MTSKDGRTKLRSLAESVKDSYEGFALGLSVMARAEGLVDETIAFMEENPEAYSVEILRYFDALVVEKQGVSMKSDAGKRLEELAKTLPEAHEDFVRFMGTMPQKHGVEEKMLEYLEAEADITTDDALHYFYQLTRS